MFIKAQKTRDDSYIEANRSQVNYMVLTGISNSLLELANKFKRFNGL